MIRTLIILCSLPLILGLSENNLYTTSGQITEYGIFAYSKDGGKSWTNPISSSPTIHEGVDSFLVMETSSIPIIKDIYFAFSYRIVGFPDGDVELDWIVIHPEMEKSDGTLSTGYSYKRYITVENGVAEGTSGYMLNQPYEQVEGEWEFSYSYKGKVLVSKIFNTYYEKGI